MKNVQEIVIKFNLRCQQRLNQYGGVRITGIQRGFRSGRSLSKSHQISHVGRYTFVFFSFCKLVAFVDSVDPCEENKTNSVYIH